jgi:hypothetical protein
MFESTQAVTVAVINGILCVIVIFLAFSNLGMSSTSFVLTISMIVYVAFMVFDTNCLVMGQCGVYAWVRTALWSIIPLIAIIIFVVFGIFTTVKKVDTKVVKQVDENTQQVTTPATTPVTKQVTAPATTPVTALVAAPQVTETFASWDSDM